MKKAIAWIFTIAAIGGLAYYAYPHVEAKFMQPVQTGTTPLADNMPSDKVAESWVSAPGVVEPASEKILLAFELSGIIEFVDVDERDEVKHGDILAGLNNNDYLARLETAKATVDARKAAYDKLVKGARKEEKTEAWAVVEQARIELENAEREAGRRQQLLEQKLIAREEVDRAVKKVDIAREVFEEARQRHLITLNASRREDIRQAYAELLAARSQVVEAEALLDKTIIRAPMDGVILRRHMHPGERVSLFTPSPVLTMGDISRLHVRADIDEKDVARVSKGQRVYVTADAFGPRKFYGRIIRLGGMMGQKNISTEHPAERNDIKVLEAIILLDETYGLVPDLRVDVFIDTNSTARSAMTTGRFPIRAPHTN